MPFHIVTDGRAMPIKFARVQDAFVYVLLRLESDVPAVNRWALIERGLDGDELVVPIGELAAEARRWRDVTRVAAEQTGPDSPEQLRPAS